MTHSSKNQRSFATHDSLTRPQIFETRVLGRTCSLGPTFTSEIDFKSGKLPCQGLDFYFPYSENRNHSFAFGILLSSELVLYGHVSHRVSCDTLFKFKHEIKTGPCFKFRSFMASFGNETSLLGSKRRSISHLSYVPLSIRRVETWLSC